MNVDAMTPEQLRNKLNDDEELIKRMAIELAKWRVWHQHHFNAQQFPECVHKSDQWFHVRNANAETQYVCQRLHRFPWGLGKDDKP